jgi:hypothetical protein
MEERLDTAVVRHVVETASLWRGVIQTEDRSSSEPGWIDIYKGLEACYTVQFGFPHLLMVGFR